MQAERVERLQGLFKQALQLNPDQQQAFLLEACPDDPQLRNEIQSLLSADQLAQDGGFLDERLLDLLPQHDEQPDESLLDHTIGPYRLLRLIGRGGMGQVYLVRRDQPFKHYAALKLSQHTLHNPEALQRFEMERQILASLNHPNIARLLDGGTTDEGLSYLVMDYVEGEPITRYCDTRRLSIPERLGVFTQVCRAVHYAHQNLIVHRDLKPSNILVSERGKGPPQVKLLDFGVAKLLNPALSSVAVPVTRTMYRMMTPEYAAPEQVRGTAVTTATDVYALGVLLYELLTGHRPYRLTSSSALELERVICEQEPERPSTMVARDETVLRGDGSREEITGSSVSAVRGVSLERLRRWLRGDLDNIVMKAMRKEAHLRYGSVEQLAQDVDRYLSGRPVEARSSTMGYRVRKFVQRHRVGVAATAVFVLLLFGFAVTMVFQQTQTAQERDRAEAALARSEAVKGFLMGLFEGSDPFKVPGDTLTAHDLLAQGVERAEELAEEPEVQAEVLHVVGNVYEHLEEYDKAEVLLTRALALRKEVLGLEHAEVAHTANQLAWLYRRKGDYDAAEPLLREALAMRRKFLGEEHPDVATSLNDLATVLKDKGNYDAAEPLFREALAMRRKLLGEEHQVVAVSLSNLALLLFYKGDYDAAEPLFREALALFRKLFGEDHPEVATVQSNLALVMADRGDLATAESMFRKVMAMDRRLMGEEHTYVAIDMNNLARVLRNQGKNTEAETLYREALAMEYRLLGEEHPRIAQSMNSTLR